jgi:hypothetical protein
VIKRRASGETPLVECLISAAACARSLVRLRVANQDRFHLDVVDELRRSLLQPVPPRPGEMISTLFRPTGDFDLEVRMSASAEGRHQLADFFDDSRVAWCNLRVIPTTSTASAHGSLLGMQEIPAWSVDQHTATLWASGAGVSPDDTAGAVQEIEAAALNDWARLGQSVRHALVEADRAWRQALGFVGPGSERPSASPAIGTTSPSPRSPFKRRVTCPRSC